MSRMRSARRLVPGLFVAALVLGCGQTDQHPLAEVEGTMTFKGKPQANVLVAFVPDTNDQSVQRSTGITDENGHFVLKTDDGRPGAVIGKHRVLLTSPRLGKRGMKGDDPDQGVPEANAEGEKLPESYATTASTPLRREVKEGKQVIDLLVD